MDPFPMIFSITATALMGMAVSKLTGVESHLSRMNGRLTDHIENKDLHYAALARTDEQIKSLTQTVRLAHERLDSISAGRA